VSEGPFGPLPPPLATPLPARVEGRRITLATYDPERDAAVLGDLVERNLAHLAILAFADRGAISLDERRTMLEGWERRRRGGMDATYGIWRATTLIGSCGLHRRRPDPTVLEIGYWIDASHEGQGYIADAVSMLVDVAFRHPEIQAVLIAADATNERSRRVAARAGFVEIATESTPADLHSRASSGVDVLSERRKGRPGS
jgi:RimJ/RimL family protein N-acetyltransferase